MFDLKGLPESEVNDSVLDYKAIMKLLPHRFPFLLVDKVVSIEDGKSIIAQKNVTFNEPFFSGHFPQDPVMPGVLQVEAMAQAGCILMMYSYAEQFKDKRPALLGVDSCKFRKAVRPGHVCTITAEITRQKRGFVTLSATFEVGGQKASEAIISATMI